MSSALPNNANDLASLIEADCELVSRCVAGDSAAWDEIYNKHHDTLIGVIGRMIGSGDANTVDEISARVWYRLIRDNFALLSRFDPQQNCRLGTFLVVIAKSEAHNFFRGEKRRVQRERLASRDESAAELGNEFNVQEISEFLKLLTDREREFFDHFLAQDKEKSQSLSQSNSWQLKSRVLKKFRAFFLPPS